MNKMDRLVIIRGTKFKAIQNKKARYFYRAFSLTYAISYFAPLSTLLKEETDNPLSAAPKTCATVLLLSFTKG